MARQNVLEGPVMAWPVTDFNGVQFNDGTGYAEVVAIHLAIKERADAVGHSLASGDYSDEWDTAQVIWHDDDYPVDGRLYLKAVLTGFYSAIGSLISGDSGIRWTETGNNNAVAWTLSSLVADIGMGAFADMLTATTNYDPFLWLHEALDRLVYRRVLLTIDSSGTITETYNGYRSGESASGVGVDALQENSWDEATGDSDHSSTTGIGASLRWQISTISSPPFYTQITKAASGRSVTNTITTGSLSAVDYSIQLTLTKFTGSTFEIAFNGNTPINIVPYGNTSFLIPGSTSDFALNSTDAVQWAVTTTPPATNPFSTVGTADFAMIRAISVLMYFYVDISGILADQA